jgi:hypothetical protein
MTVMREITVRIVGTICFVDGSGAFKKRLVIPVDTLYPRDKPQLKHIPYVEFPDRIVSGSGCSAVYQHPKNKGKIDYRRFELSNHVISIENVDTTDTFVVKQSFSDHVVKMKTLAPALDPTPRKECFDATPDGKIIAGFFDISYGTLKAGELHEDVMSFDVLSGQPIDYRVRAAKFSELLIRVTLPLTVSFTSANLGTTKIVLTDDVDVITIGNQPVGDIEGEGSGESVREDFRLNYELCDPVNHPTDPPLPKQTAGATNACSVNTWP